MAQWDDELRRELPDGRGHLRRAHAPRHRHRRDGRASYEELTAIMDRYGISRAFVFCLDEPDRHPGFRAGERPNARVRGRSEGRLIPFVRLDLSETRSRRRALPRPRRARASSCTRGRRSSCSTTTGSRRSSRSRPSAACRSSSTAAAACRRSRTTSRGSSTVSGRAADHRPRGDRRSRRPRRPLRGQGGRLLRHLGLEPARPARPLPARPDRSRSSTRRTTRTGSSRPRS